MEVISQVEMKTPTMTFNTSNKQYSTMAGHHNSRQIYVISYPISGAQSNCTIDLNWQISLAFPSYGHEHGQKSNTELKSELLKVYALLSSVKQCRLLPGQ